MNAKKISTFEREHSSNGNPRLHNVFGSPVKKANTKVKKAVQGKKSDFSKKKSQKSRKKQNDEFSHEKSKTGRFFYRSLFLPGAFGGAFYPIYGTCPEPFTQPEIVKN